MEQTIRFSFRNKLSDCSIYIDTTIPPCFVFIDLKDVDLINEFGPEITVKTDFKKRLPKTDDYPALVELRQAIFNAMEKTPGFLLQKV